MKNKQVNFNVNSESYARTEFKNFCNQYDLDFSEISSIVTSTAYKDKNFSNEDFSSIQNLDQLFDFCMVNFGLGSFLAKGFKNVKNLFKGKPKKALKPKFEGKTKPQSQTLKEHGGTVPKNPATNKAPTNPTGKQSGVANDFKKAKQQSIDTQKSVRQQNAIAKENRFNELERERAGKGFFRQIGTDVKQFVNSPGKFVNRHFVRAGLGATTLAGAGLVGAGAVHAAGRKDE